MWQIGRFGSVVARPEEMIRETQTHKDEVRVFWNETMVSRRAESCKNSPSSARQCRSVLKPPSGRWQSRCGAKRTCSKTLHRCKSKSKHSKALRAHSCRNKRRPQTHPWGTLRQSVPTPTQAQNESAAVRGVCVSGTSHEMGSSAWD
jgi:hypothetical protein